MCQREIMNPEIDRIKNDEFYLFYEMMIQSLKTENVKEGINHSLALLRSFLNSGTISLYVRNKEGNYIFRISDTPNDELRQSIGCIVNKTKTLSEEKGILDLDLKLSDKLDTLKLVHTEVNDVSCIAAFVNIDRSKHLEPLFWERTRDTMQVVLKRAKSYERNKKAITTDLLTELENRNSYEMRLSETINADQELVFALFDLFRLKYVNDNFDHTVGDTYIKTASGILRKYWPKDKIILNEDSTESFEPTGHVVYRIGGDEFVMISSVENEQLAGIKAGLAADEVSMSKLEYEVGFPLGMNYGVVKHLPGESLKDTYRRADAVMQEDKDKMYKTLKLERRH